MSHVVAPEPEPPEEGLLEREHDGEPVDRGGEPARALGPPRPELRSDVVEDLGARGARRFGDAQMETGIVDEDDQIVAACAEVFPKRPQQPPVGAELAEDLDDAEGREALHRIAHRRARLRHARAAERVDRGVGVPCAQSANDAGAVQIP